MRPEPVRHPTCSLFWRFASAGLACTVAGTALAQSPDVSRDAPSNPAEAERILDERRRQLDATADKADALQTDVADLDAERERLNSRLVETAALIQRSEAQMTSIEGRLSELEAQEKLVRGSLGQRHGQIATLLGALQRMGRNPPPVLITRREDALKMVRSAMLLSSAFPELWNPFPSETPTGLSISAARQVGQLLVATKTRSMVTRKSGGCEISMYRNNA